jgi:hypothetical protein
MTFGVGGKQGEGQIGEVLREQSLDYVGSLPGEQ